MKFFRETSVRLASQDVPVNAPAIHKTITDIRDRVEPMAAVHLTTLDGVAEVLGVSKRFVQTLIKRKIIPVIRLGRRCNRFDLDRVLAAVKKYEVEEYGRR